MNKEITHITYIRSFDLPIFMCSSETEPSQSGKIGPYLEFPGDLDPSLQWISVKITLLAKKCLFLLNFKTKV